MEIEPKKYIDLQNISNLEYSIDDDSENEKESVDEGILLVGEDFQNKIFMENFTSKVVESFKSKNKKGGKKSGKGGDGKGSGKGGKGGDGKGSGKGGKGDKNPPPSSEIADTIEMKLKKKLPM